MNNYSQTIIKFIKVHQKHILIIKIVAAFRGMHVSPASVTDRRTDRQTDGQTDGRTTDKVIPMCRYASQATQKQNSGSLEMTNLRTDEITFFRSLTKIGTDINKAIYSNHNTC